MIKSDEVSSSLLSMPNCLSDYQQILKNFDKLTTTDHKGVVVVDRSTTSLVEPNTSDLLEIFQQQVSQLTTSFHQTYPTKYNDNDNSLFLQSHVGEILLNKVNDVVRVENELDKIGHIESESQEDEQREAKKPVESRSLCIRVGSSGKAKNNENVVSRSNSGEQLKSSSYIVQELNYGDDVAFVCRPSPANKWYFGIADGVSANRLRGYDAKLFPNALIRACCHLIFDYNRNAMTTTKPSQLCSNTTDERCYLDASRQLELDEFYHRFKEKLDIDYSFSRDLICDEAYTDNTDLTDSLNEKKTSLSNHKYNGEHDYDSDKDDVDDDDDETYRSHEGDGDDNDSLQSYNKMQVNKENDAFLDTSLFYAQMSECSFLLKILEQAHGVVQEEQIFGSSTACLFSLTLNSTYSSVDETTSSQVVTLIPATSSVIETKTESAAASTLIERDHALLSTCNLGDSGFIVLRDRRAIYKSISQSHRVNAPYQLGCTPPELLEHDLYRDRADDSYFSTHLLLPGDILIISSDGLFDNLYEDEIAMIVYEHLDAQSRSRAAKTHDTDDLVIDSNSNLTATSNSIPYRNVNSELLDSTCDLLVEKASKANIKRDDILVLIVYIE